MVQMSKTIKKIVAVGGEVLPLGLKLAGIKETYTVGESLEAEKLMADLLDRKDIGIIVVTGGVQDSIKDKRIRNKMENSIDPIVVSVPGYKEKEAQEDTLRKLILRAVGIDIMEFGEKK